MRPIVDDIIDKYLNTLLTKEKRVRENKEKKTKKKSCLYCRKEFTGGGDKKQFCSEKCYAASHKEKYHKNKETKPIVSRVCAHCGKSFESFREGKIYCTVTCRDRKWRNHVRERYAITFGKRG